MIGIPARQNLHCTFKHSVFGSKMQQLEDRNAMLTKEELPPCPVATTLMLIGNKWKSSSSNS